MKQYEIDFYQENLNKHTPGDARSFGWWSEENRQIRFDVLNSLIPSNLDRPVTILDLGCGDGRFIFQLWAENKEFQFIGIDAMAGNIALADLEADLIDCPAKFIHYDWDGIEPLPIEGEVDLIFESGLFATMPAAVRNHMLLQLFSIPRIGFCGTFLTPSISMKKISAAIVPVMPAEIVRLIDIDLYGFVLLADYLRHDFAIGVYKR